MERELEDWKSRQRESDSKQEWVRARERSIFIVLPIGVCVCLTSSWDMFLSSSSASTIVRSFYIFLARWCKEHCANCKFVISFVKIARCWHNVLSQASWQESGKQYALKLKIWKSRRAAGGQRRKQNIRESVVARPRALCEPEKFQQHFNQFFVPSKIRAL